MGVSLVKLSVAPRLCPPETLRMLEQLLPNTYATPQNRSGATPHLAKYCTGPWLHTYKGSGLLAQRRQKVAGLDHRGSLMN